MSFVRIWVHLVFSTKDRSPFFSKEIRPLIYNHIQLNCREKGIFLTDLNGHLEHIHCLISLNKNQTISQVAQLIKGESAFWINKEKIIAGKFAWQDDYFAVSISESQIESVQNYIRNQEDHHKKKSFSMEIEEFNKKYNWLISSEFGNKSDLG
ncbi:MAG: IS200/IS605 family transposase [Bacteroidetes bacterium]|nr:IS200/IS605 family transposase [Bacteroidota bacterium]